MTRKLQSENVVIAAPFSFIGSAQRIWRITKVENQWIRWLLLAPITVVITLFAWIFVACWYFLIYVLFGLWFIPYRFLRRGSRKRKQERLRHREILDAIEHNR